MNFNRTVPVFFKSIKKKGRRFTREISDKIETKSYILDKYISEKNITTIQSKILRKRFKEYLDDVGKVIFSNTQGFEIPNRLGYILVGEFISNNKKCVDFVKTKELKKQGVNKVIYHTNQHTDGRAFMFHYKKIIKNPDTKSTHCFKKTIYKNYQYWTFKKCRTLSCNFYKFMKDNDFTKRYIKSYDIMNQHF